MPMKGTGPDRADAEDRTDDNVKAAQELDGGLQANDKAVADADATRISDGTDHARPSI